VKGNKTGFLKERAALLQAVRSFFIEQGYLEVETPVRLPALAPEAYIEPEAADDWFLQTSPELCMKRLLAAGLPKIFQICKCFRKKERGRYHLPEMTMLEWYAADRDYLDLMTDCEALFQRLLPQNNLKRHGQIIDLTAPWQRLSLAQAFEAYAPISEGEAIAAGSFDEMLVTMVEPHLGQDKPVFLYDYPAALASLARLHPNNPKLAQRFELYIAGLELANGFTELNNPLEQRQRFRNEQDLMTSHGRQPGPMPEAFLEALSHMPPAAGIAMGLDRLVMLCTGAETIDQVVSFTPEEL